MIAAEYCQSEVVEILLQLPNIDIDAEDYEFQESALMTAAWRDNLDFIKMLIKHSTTKIDGGLALIRASKKGHVRIVEFLLEHFEIVEDDAFTSLVEAAGEGHLEVVKVILLTQPGRANINYWDSNSNETALVTAAENGHIQVVDYLLGLQDIDINQGNGFGQSALMRAAVEDRTDVVEILLGTRGINVNLRVMTPYNSSHEGKTALMFAAEFGQIGVVRTLLTCNNINVNIAGIPVEDPKNKLTAFEMAVSNGHVEVADMLLRCPGYNYNSVSSKNVY